MSELKQGSYKIGFALKKNNNNGYDVQLNDYNYDGKESFVDGKLPIATFENSNGKLTPNLNDDAITEAINNIAGKNEIVEVNTANNQVATTPDQVDNTPGQVATTTDQVDNTANLVDNTPDQVATTPDQLDNTANPVDNTPDQVDNTDKPVDNTNKPVDNTNKPVDNKNDVFNPLHIGGTRRIKRRKSRGKKSKSMKRKMSKRRRYK